MKANYKQIRAALANLETFTGNSLSAIISGDEYTVISYRTPIARWNLVTGEKWLDPKRYSVTTTKQQNIIRHAWGV